MTDQLKPARTSRLPWRRLWPRIRRERKARTVTITRDEYLRLHNAADVLDGLAGIIRKALDGHD